MFQYSVFFHQLETSQWGHYPTDSLAQTEHATELKKARRRVVQCLHIRCKMQGFYMHVRIISHFQESSSSSSCKKNFEQKK